MISGFAEALKGCKYSILEQMNRYCTPSSSIPALLIISSVSSHYTKTNKDLPSIGR